MTWSSRIKEIYLLFHNSTLTIYYLVSNGKVPSICAYFIPKTSECDFFS